VVLESVAGQLQSLHQSIAAATIELVGDFAVDATGDQW